ncbi:ROK family transcriptional regulator [Caulobacter sp. CCH5-E12]|uniref:ROK family transcriptional regulator n=1 Tax=Caulobacter sp. CCH5-E12 TaxID=1768770 RepID=UPI000783071E|nr:ROK family transcriptional regulator [Caulobacter sp. CCH5-E12]
MPETTLWTLSPSERTVLRAIWRHAPISRNAIAKLTGLAPASATRLVRDLELRGLVADSVLRSGGRGQPSRPLTLRAEGAYSFGVYFSHSYMEMGLIDLAGGLVSHERLRFAVADAEVIAQVACAGLLRQTAHLGISLDRVIGAGFALPGDFGETPAFLKAHAYFPALFDRDLAAEFASAMPVPVFVENDAASAALGERVNGQGRDLKSFLYVHIGHGIGGGLVLDGRLYRGERGNAGVIGTIYPMGEPRPSGQDLLESLAARGVAAADFDALEDLRPEDCPPLRQWIARAGAQLETGIHIAARILDPSAVILGGRLPPHIVSALLQAIDVDAAFKPSRVIPAPPVLASSLGSFAGLIGAASICLFEVLFKEEESAVV